MERRISLLFVLSFLMFAEALSWVTARGPGPCLIKPEHSQQATNNGEHPDCPTFFLGSLLTFERGFEWIKKDDNDKAVVAAFTVVLAVSTIGLWLATNALWRAGEKQFRLLSETAAVQSRDMQSSISAANAANELNRRNFEGVHRPKIRIKHFILVSDVWQGEPIRVDITCVNYGTTEAILQNIGVRCFIVPNDRELPIDPEIPAVLPVIGASLQSGLNYQFPNIDTQAVISPEQNVAIQDGKSKLFCVGYVSYFDAAAKLRITGFCRVLRFPDDGAALAHKGNCRFLKFEDPDYEYED